MRAAVVGMGTVGLSLAAVMASRGVRVHCVEKDGRLRDLLRECKPPFHEPGLAGLLRRGRDLMSFSAELGRDDARASAIFLAVGTPASRGGADLGAVREAAASAGAVMRGSRGTLVAVKSTVPPGATWGVVRPRLERASGLEAGKNLLLACMPEFLREGHAVRDQLRPHAAVVGADDIRSRRRASAILKRIMPADVPVLHDTLAGAEMAKHANNAFLATKVSFINTIAGMCERVPGANVDSVARSLGADPRIGPLFLQAGPGFGGPCLPKDLDALIGEFGKAGADSALLRGVRAANKARASSVLSAISSRLGRGRQARVAVLGLAFKEGTGDVRGSRSVWLARALARSGYGVRLHDPLALDAARRALGAGFQYCKSVAECIDSADCAVVMTAWRGYARLSRRQISRMRRQLVIDTRRVLRPGVARELVSVGAGPRTDVKARPG